MLDRQLLGGARHLVHEVLQLGRIGMGIAARKAATDIDGIDDDTGRHDQLTDLPDRLAEGGGNDRLRAHMEGQTETLRDLARAQQERRRLIARGPELALQRNEAVGIGTGHAEEEREISWPRRSRPRSCRAPRRCRRRNI